jgi:hypothetical protein
LRISTGTACSWAAEALDSWLHVQDPTPKVGSGTVTFTVDSNLLNGREGRLRLAIANQTFVIAQGPQCTYSVVPEAVSMPGAGGTGTIEVRAPAGCEWSARASVPWIVVSPGAGAGNGSVSFSVQTTTGTAREGTFTVAGRTIRVSQGLGCDYTVSPPSLTVPAAGRTDTLVVSTDAECAWSSETGNLGPLPWVSLAPLNGVGSGPVTVRVLGNDGPQRQAAMTVAGRPVLVTQASGCTFTVTPVQPPTAGQAAFNGTLTIAVPEGSETCSWSATTTAEWITLGRTSGVGGASLPYSLLSNDTAGVDNPRTGQIRVTGDGSVSLVITIQQAGDSVVR